MRKKILISGLAISIILVTWGIYNYRKPHTNAAASKPTFSLSANELFKQYEQNEMAANKKFADKVLEVRGTIIAIEHTDSTANIELASGETMGNINCSFILSKEQSNKLPSKNSEVNIKGRCTGFLADVNLVDCVIEQ